MGFFRKDKLVYCNDFVGYWLIGNFMIVPIRKELPTKEQIENTETLLGWKFLTESDKENLGSK